MTLRRRSKAIEDLRLANLQDYIITEDDGELSPCTTRSEKPSRIVPRRVNEDSYEDILTSFQKFKWEEPKIDGRVLCDYRRFVTAMTPPTKEAIKPWVEWVERQLGWERVWILENPVATKREIMRRFEGSQEHDDENIVDVPQTRFITPHRLEIQDSLENLRKGAVSRMEFREEKRSAKWSSSTLSLRVTADEASGRSTIPVASREIGKNNESSGSLLGRNVERSTSALGFRDVKKLRGHFSSLKKKALTNPWLKGSQAVKE